jgi:hypothetical protein
MRHRTSAGIDYADYTRCLEPPGEVGCVVGDVDLDVVETPLSQAYTRVLQPAAREHIHAALLELDAVVPEGLAECPSGCASTTVDSDTARIRCLSICYTRRILPV